MAFLQIQMIISGRVQGVGFRYATLNEAQRLGVVGWVKNLPNGSVETLGEGTLEQIESFLSWCHEGPPSSHVDEVKISQRKEVATLSFQRFQIHK